MNVRAACSVTAAVAMAGALSLATAIPANASTALRFTARGIHNGALTTYSDTEAAGYLSQPSAGVTSEEGGAVVPHVICPATGDAFLDQSVQFDTLSSTSIAGGLFIVESCSNGVASYSAQTFIGTAAKQATFTVAPGQSVGALITVSSSGAFKVSAKDVTTGKTFTQSGTEPIGTVYYAWAIDQNYDGDLTTYPIPQFTSPIGFKMIINNEPVSQETPSTVDMVDSSNNIIISTSPLTSSGEEFTTTFVASS